MMRRFSDGFEILENVLSTLECDDLIAYLVEIQGPHRKAGIRGLMRHCKIAELASDPRMIAITKEISGRQLIPFKATLFQKAGRANWLVAWHQDTALPVERVTTDKDWGPFSVKDGVTFAHAPTSALSKILALRIHLDASTPENGPLRVIPGSHRNRICDEEFSKWTKRPSVECLVGAGGVIAMSPLLIHASSKCVGDAPRRVLHIEYAMNLQIESGVTLAFA